LNSSAGTDSSSSLPSSLHNYLPRIRPYIHMGICYADTHIFFNICGYHRVPGDIYKKVLKLFNHKNV